MTVSFLFRVVIFIKIVYNTFGDVMKCINCNFELGELDICPQCGEYQIGVEVKAIFFGKKEGKTLFLASFFSFIFALFCGYYLLVFRNLLNEATDIYFPLFSTIPLLIIALLNIFIIIRTMIIGFKKRKVLLLTCFISSITLVFVVCSIIFVWLGFDANPLIKDLSSLLKFM